MHKKKQYVKQVEVKYSKYSAADRDLERWKTKKVL